MGQQPPACTWGELHQAWPKHDARGVYTTPSSHCTWVGRQLSTFICCKHARVAIFIFPRPPRGARSRVRGKDPPDGVRGQAVLAGMVNAQNGKLLLRARISLCTRVSLLLLCVEDCCMSSCLRDGGRFAGDDVLTG